MATSGVAGLVYARTLVDLATGEKIDLSDLVSESGPGLQIGTTGTTAMAGNKVPTATQRGGVLLQTAQADLTDAPTAQDFNALLAKLRSAGLLNS